MDLIKLMKRRTVITAVIYLAAGLILVVFPQITAEVLCTALGVLAAAVGLMYLLTFLRDLRKGWEIQSDLIAACLWGIVAVFVFVRQDVLLSIIPVVLGFAVLINGVLKLSVALRTRTPDSNGWVFCLVCALAELAAGLFFVLDPLRVAAGLIVAFGVVLLFSGVTDLIALILLRNLTDEAQEIHDVELLDPKDTDPRE